MRLAAALLLSGVIATEVAHADADSDFRNAYAIWRSRAETSYSFDFSLRDEVVVAPPCGGATIRVVVKNGVPNKKVVVKGTPRCRTGTSGKAIGFDVPNTLEAVFDRMRRYIYSPPLKVAVSATYDAVTGVPITYHVKKLEFEDDDEGFAISNYRVIN
jgi:hypothetical protein